MTSRRKVGEIKSKNMNKYKLNILPEDDEDEEEEDWGDDDEDWGDDDLLDDDEIDDWE